MAKYLRIAAIVVVGGALAYSALLAWSFYYDINTERAAFSSATWKEKANVYAHNSDPGCVRGDMALDIVATNLLQGQRIADVKALLGEPDGAKKSVIYYELGQCSGLGWHDSVLQVNFSSNQQVINAVILRH